MLTENFFKICPLFLKYAEIFCVAPFCWTHLKNSKRDKIEITAWLIYSFALFNLEIFVGIWFMLLQICRLKYSFCEENAAMLSFLYVMVSCGAVTITLSLQFYRKNADLANVFVAWIHFLQTFRGKTFLNRFVPILGFEF